MGGKKHKQQAALWLAAVVMFAWQFDSGVLAISRMKLQGRGNSSRSLCLCACLTTPPTTDACGHPISAKQQAAANIAQQRAADQAAAAQCGDEYPCEPENPGPKMCPRAMSELSKTHPDLATSMQTPCQKARAQQAAQDDQTDREAAQAAQQAGQTAMGNAMQFKQLPTNSTDTLDKCGHPMSRPMPITAGVGLKAKQAMDKAQQLAETSQCGQPGGEFPCDAPAVRSISKGEQQAMLKEKYPGIDLTQPCAVKNYLDKQKEMIEDRDLYNISTGGVSTGSPPATLYDFGEDRLPALQRITGKREINLDAMSEVLGLDDSLSTKDDDLWNAKYMNGAAVSTLSNADDTIKVECATPDCPDSVRHMK